MNPEDDQLRRLIHTLLIQLRNAGIHVTVTHHRTPSLYLHLDHDVLKEIRLSDHPMGKKSRHRVGYDILITRDRHRRFAAENRCFQYGINNALTVVAQVVADRDRKVAQLGGSASYRSLVRLAQKRPQLPSKQAAFENKLSAFLDHAPVSGGRRERPRI
ncbi:MAG: hypothetical protein LKH74_08445 [Levilactobacillus sp.]|jgi:hypothetical protein|uniref:hypothetical protein n=1 Tax=Levilactobacillus sp. TaxID=2767919 RepID=UPI00258C8ED2|nr:hypothetical protein [Levilactobacillus sp.]MCH4123842.1 hypothetical protein [Levilactobacillus sp.]MCI1553940.1 hypothetical protein [Levilactobacillus sp.]MCI1605477.1 hypothetical protein [Levilactobacillus sp.]